MGAVKGGVDCGEPVLGVCCLDDRNEVVLDSRM